MARRTTNGIDVTRLNQEILDLGVRVKVYKSTLCPNMKSLESHDHNINCKLCSNQMIDFCPTETIAIFQQQVLTEQFKVSGTFHVDEVMVSFLAGVTLFTYARVDLLDFQEDFTELVQRQVGTNVDTLKYKACEVLGLFSEVSGARVQYHFGTDFDLDENGSVKWKSLHKPADKKVYTVYYRYHPIYRAVKAVHRDRYSQFNIRADKIDTPKTVVNGRTYIKLPETWILIRQNLIDRKDQQGQPIQTNDFYDPNA